MGNKKENIVMDGGVRVRMKLAVRSSSHHGPGW